MVSAGCFPIVVPIVCAENGCARRSRCCCADRCAIQYPCTHRFSVMPEAKVAVVMFSEEFFKSESCVKELSKILEQTSGLAERVIPVFVGSVDMSAGFLGEKKSQRREAAFIRTMVSGNCIPPPDMGLFQDNWDANVALLIQRAKELIA
jgi:hypothetical protein